MNCIRTPHGSVSQFFDLKPLEKIDGNDAPANGTQLTASSVIQDDAIFNYKICQSSFAIPEEIYYSNSTGTPTIPDFTDGVSIAYWATNVEVPVEAVEGVSEVLNEDGTVETAAVEAVPAKTYTYTLQKTFNRPAWNTIAYPEAE